MKRLLFFILIVLAFFVVPVLAVDNQLNITTTLGTPVWYVVDYGAGTTASLTSYSFETSVNYPTANQTWSIYGSDTLLTSTLVDRQDLIAFVAVTPQTFVIGAPTDYRYYYIYLENGFYDRTSTLTVHFISTTVDYPPVDAQFAGTPTFGYDDGFGAFTVWFNDLSLGFPSIWDWDFGDGSAHSTLQNPSHVYAYAGNYTVKLTATGEYASDSETRTDYITIWNATTLPEGVGNITNYNTYNTYGVNETTGRRPSDAGAGEIYRGGGYV